MYQKEGRGSKREKEIREWRATIIDINFKHIQICQRKKSIEVIFNSEDL